ncbi:MAG: zinc ribbon domain-containing protein [Coriobacteriales bacterium]|jgi:hypothetical protein|nr:zinc ribbon domain-containing protein [Coriobacteriales bacterium]
MYCAKCGLPIKDNVRFCAGCGAPVEHEATVSLPAVAQASQTVRPAPTSVSRPQASRRKAVPFAIIAAVVIVLAGAVTLVLLDPFSWFGNRQTAGAATTDELVLTYSAAIAKETQNNMEMYGDEVARIDGTVFDSGSIPNFDSSRLNLAVLIELDFAALVSDHLSAEMSSDDFSEGFKELMGGRWAGAVMGIIPSILLQGPYSYTPQMMNQSSSFSVTHIEEAPSISGNYIVLMGYEDATVVIRCTAVDDYLVCQGSWIIPDVSAENLFADVVEYLESEWYGDLERYSRVFTSSELEDMIKN